jgi:tetratricopeptide (TPR) repeat protein
MELNVKTARNDPCPCGSGRRYKTCCGRLTAGGETEARERRAQEGAEAVDLIRLAALMDAGRYAELEDAAREVQCAYPESGFVWQLLGVALSKQGKDALQALAAAARCMPADAVAHLNLGNALARLGRLDEARASYGRALAIRPDFAEAHQNLGEVLVASGQFEAAAASCRRALEFKPDLAEAHGTLATASMKLANALRSIGRLDEAAAGYRRALQSKPDLAAAHIELATALRLQQRTDESEASCRNALDLDPNSVAALAVLAELRADTGRFAAAEELYKRAISIDPQAAEAWAGLARLRRMTDADGAWLVAAQDLAGRGLPPHRELLLRYAIGKYFDDVKDFENAFFNYRRANELAKQCGPGHDRAQLTRAIDLIIRSHDQRWIEQERNASNPSARPVFIIGMLRSGTTLAEQILASHPAVFGAGELTFWGAESAAAIASASAMNARELPVSDATLAALGNQYLELLQRLSPDALRVVNKFPTNFLFLGLIHAALPHARIIHMRRNPIDTCLSVYFQHFEAANTYANDLEDLAHYHCEYQRLMRHWRTVLPANAMLDVPYEGLVLDLPAWCRRMLDFIALPWDERCLDFHRTARIVGTASRWQVRQKISTSSVERWRNYEKFVGPLKSLLVTSSLSRS